MLQDGLGTHRLANEPAEYVVTIFSVIDTGVSVSCRCYYRMRRTVVDFEPLSFCLDDDNLAVGLTLCFMDGHDVRSVTSPVSPFY